MMADKADEAHSIPVTTRAAQRDERRAAALRANLGRRKLQARERRDLPAVHGDEPPAETSGAAESEA